MAYKILFLITVFIGISCQQSKNDIDNIKYVEVDFIWNGVESIYKGQFNQNDQPHGFGQFFTKEGVKLYEGNFDKGKLNGWSTIFNDDGSKTSLFFFQGKRGDLRIEYFPEGSLKSIYYVHDGEYKYKRDYLKSGEIDTTFYRVNNIYGSNINNTFSIKYEFVDPFFKGGWVDLYFSDTLGNHKYQERIEINSKDSAIFSKPIKHGFYKVVFEFYSKERNELMIRADHSLPL
ncbi:MAG TPA: hypothetical protein P5338_07830 [Bacteroidales bacterium]|nr:hypothetical protein [Bacteroidales bacterium]